MPEPSESDKQRARSICGCYRHEEIARAIASAREEGRREGMEEALARFEAIKAQHRATADALREVYQGDRSAWFWDEEARKADDAADVIRALIGGNE